MFELQKKNSGWRAARARIAAAAQRFSQEQDAKYKPPPPPPPPPPSWMAFPSNVIYLGELPKKIKVALAPTINVQTVQNVVAREYKISLKDLLSRRKDHRTVRARYIAIHLAKVLTSRSLPDLGRRFDGRDHTSILHAVRKMERLLETDAKLRADVERCTQLVMGAHQ
jgi:hypothetical protein